MRDRLADCHARIRRFCALAKRLSEGGPDDQVRDAAGQLHRYFTIGLPLHMRDEEESVRPRLERLRDPTLSAALETMSAEHVAVDVELGHLVEQWGVIAHEPTEARCLATRTPAIWLYSHMLRHLAHEELRIFPTLDLLPPGQWSEIVAEMAARRR